MPTEILARLKALQYPRSEQSPFQSHHEFLVWSDQVAPLLTYDEQTHRSFKRAVSDVKSMSAIHRVESPMHSINHTFGILNQAVTALELKIEESRANTLVRAAHNTPLVGKSQTRSARLKVWWGTWGWTVTIFTSALGLAAAVLKFF